MRAGMPPMTTLSGKSPLTTLPAAMVQSAACEVGPKDEVSARRKEADRW